MRIMYFDTETTGLVMPSSAPLDKQPKIIELGIVVFNNGKEESFIGQLLEPQMYITEEITKITGITNDDVRDKPTFTQFLPQIREAFSRCDVVIAHNMAFDQAMLEFELQRVNCQDFPWPPERVCSAQEFAPVLGYRPTLKALYEEATGEPLAQTHRALDDARALATACERLRLPQTLWPNNGWGS